MTDAAELFDALLQRETSTPALEGDDALERWWQQHLACASPSVSPGVRAVLCGFAADRLAWAFASGYTEAMRQLLGAQEPPRRRALCASEAGGGHPRAIACSLAFDAGSGSGRLNGRKSFVTFGAQVEELIVVASIGEDAEGKNRLRALRIPSRREGLEILALGQTPFVPELPHGSLELSEVRVEAAELLEGDAYLKVLKPFRTIEDIHVFLALLGWLTRLGRVAAWPAVDIERGLTLIASLLALAGASNPLAPGLHRALGGALAAVGEHLEGLDRTDAWARLPADVGASWARDRRLLQVAGKARARRLDVARV